MTPTLKRLDDPQERWKYSKRLWKAIVISPTYLFWRVVGKVFKRQDWYERGTELTPNPVFKLPKMSKREIKLETFGWKQEYSQKLYRNRQPEYTYFDCGYDAETDTLWIRE
jgi:hypothetical protein